MYIKNAVVKMLWDAEGFFETKKDGFIAAVQLYENKKTGETLAVMFKNGKAFMIFDNETEKPATRDDLRDALSEIIKTDPEGDMEEYFPDTYIELCNGVTCDADVADAYGLDEDDQEDIINRCDDLSGYYVTEYEDM